MRKSRIAIIIIAAFAVCLLAISWPTVPEPGKVVSIKTTETYPQLLFTFDIIRYPSSAEISDISSGNISLAFNITPGSIDFGTVPPMGTSRRQINLSSRQGISQKIAIKTRGNLSGLVSASDEDFILNSSKDVSLIFSAGNMTPGMYTGEIDVIIQKSNSDLTRWIFGY